MFIDNVLHFLGPLIKSRVIILNNAGVIYILSDRSDKHRIIHNISNSCKLSMCINLSQTNGKKHFLCTEYLFLFKFICIFCKQFLHIVWITTFSLKNKLWNNLVSNVFQHFYAKWRDRMVFRALGNPLEHSLSTEFDFKKHFIFCAFVKIVVHKKIEEFFNFDFILPV